MEEPSSDQRDNMVNLQHSQNKKPKGGLITMPFIIGTFRNQIEMNIPFSIYSGFPFILPIVQDFFSLSLFHVAFKE